MSREIVGQIETYDVIYIPEKDMVFCKNTTCHYGEIHKALISNLERHNIDNGKLILTKDQCCVTLGCLTTTKSNIMSIDNKIKKLRK